MTRQTVPTPSPKGVTVSKWSRDTSTNLTPFRTTQHGPTLSLPSEVLLEDIAAGTLAFPLPEDQPHQQTSYFDVARATRVAFENPHEFIGTEHNLVSDVGTLAEITATINEVGGFGAEPYYVPIEDAYEEFGEEFGTMTEWWHENDGERSFFGDPSETEGTFGFEPQSFEAYLRANGWEGGKEEPAHIVGWAKAMG